MRVEDLQRAFTTTDGNTITLTAGKSLVVDYEDLANKPARGNIAISDTAPDFGGEAGLWIDTSGGNITFWIEDGL